MAQRSALGGGNMCEFFTLTTSAFATKLSHVEDNTKSLKTTGHPNKKSLKLNFDALHADTAFETFLSTYLTEKNYEAITENFEDGSSVSASAAPTSKQFGYILYFGVLGASRKHLYGVGVVSGDTGNYETGYNSFEKTPIEISAVPAATAYSIPAASFNTSYVTGAATVTLAAGSYGVYAFLTAV